MKNPIAPKTGQSLRRFTLLVKIMQRWRCLPGLWLDKWVELFFALLPSASQLPLSAASDILPTLQFSFPLCKSTTKRSCFIKCPFTIFSNGISVRLDHHLLRKQSFMSAKIHGLPGDVDRRLRQRKSCRFVNILLQSIFGQGWEAGYSAQLPAH